MKKFFNIEKSYEFDWGDLRAVAMVINVVLTMIFGLSIAWLGLGIAIIGIVRDLSTDRRINSLIIHFASVALNIFFILQL